MAQTEFNFGARHVLEIDDESCHVYPTIPKKLTSELTYIAKAIEAEDPDRPWERAVTRTATALYTKKPYVNKERGLVGERLTTFAGLASRAMRALLESNIKPEIVDLRTPRPPYHLDKALAGLYPIQAVDLAKMLASGGGIGQFPTGFGKTHMMAALLRAHRLEELHGRGTPLSVVTVADVSVAKKNYDDLCELLPDRHVGLITGNTTRRTEDIMVVTAGSLSKLTEPERVGILIGDEVHGLSSESRGTELLRFKRALKWALSATVFGRFDGGDKRTEALFGPVVAQRTYQEGVDAGILVPLQVCVLPLPVPACGAAAVRSLRDHGAIIRNGLDLNEALASTVGSIMHAIPNSMQALAIMQHTTQLDLIIRYCPPDTAYVHGQTSGVMEKAQCIAPVPAKVRDRVYEHMKSGKIRKCLATYVYKQGVNFPALEVVICPGGGASSIVYGQIPGRASRKTAGKDRAYIVEFEPYWDVTKTRDSDGDHGVLMREFMARKRVYAQNGFEICNYTSWEDLPFLKKGG